MTCSRCGRGAKLHHGPPAHEAARRAGLCMPCWRDGADTPPQGSPRARPVDATGAADPAPACHSAPARAKARPAVAAPHVPPACPPPTGGWPAPAPRVYAPAAAPDPLAERRARYTLERVLLLLREGTPRALLAARQLAEAALETHP